MVFGDGTVGSANTLYLTAGLASGTSGLFSSITVNASGARPDFSVTASPPSVTAGAGQPANFSITAAPMANFRGAFSFSCNAPANVTCSIGSQSIDPLTGSATVAVTVTTSSAPRATSTLALVLPGVLFLGLGFRKRRRSISAFLLAFGFLALTVVGVTGCSSYNGAQISPQPTTQSLSITVTSGAVSHTTLLTLQVQ